VLYSAAKRFANIEIAFGVDDFAIDEKDGKAAVTFKEKGNRKRTVKPFALVGADGVRSAVRTQFLGGREPAYSGKVAWRALVAPDKLDGVLNLDRVSVLFGTRHHLVVYPLPHRNTVNLALFTQEHERDLEKLAQSHPTLRQKRDPRFNAILAAAGDSWTPWVLSEVDIERWHKGAIGLIGDAAHAMLPFQAQGAAMGIEDATVLAPLLVSAPGAEHAFARFTALRQQRVRRVQAVSRKNGRIFHMGFPLSLFRDHVIRSEGAEGHFKRLEWLYGHDPAPSETAEP
jgi:salicylate hydroxylase